MFSSFRYHNEPEGHNLLDKASSLVRLGAIYGAYRAGYKIIYGADRPTRTIGQSASIILWHMGLPMAVGFTYALARYTLTNMRKKEDPWNAFLAGAVNAPVVYGFLSQKLHNEARLIVLLPILLGAGAILAEVGYDLMSLDAGYYRGTPIKAPFRPVVHSKWLLE